MAQHLQNHTCLICRSSGLEELLHIGQFPLLFGAIPAERKGKVKRYPLTVAVCNQCSLIQQVNLLPSSVLNDVYTSDYYSCPAPSENNVGHRVIGEFYNFFKKHAPKPGRLLEIACFDGYLLGLLQKNGWDVYGCDPAGQTSRAIKKFGKERIMNDFFSRKNYPDEKFDVIVFRHLLEHIYDLHSFLNEVAAVLKEDGCLFIEVPNIYATFDFGGLGSFFHQHVSHFSIDTLTMLLRQHGFTVEAFEAASVLHVKAMKAKTAVGNGPMGGDIKARKDAFLAKYRNIEEGIKQLFADPAIGRIAIFGASAGATAIANMIDGTQRQKVKGVFDNDLTKQGKYIDGVEVPIAPPQTIKAKDIDAIIITSYIFAGEITAQLRGLGVDPVKIIAFENLNLAGKDSL